MGDHLGDDEGDVAVRPPLGHHVVRDQARVELADRPQRPERAGDRPGRPGCRRAAASACSSGVRKSSGPRRGEPRASARATGATTARQASLVASRRAGTRPGSRRRPSRRSRQRQEGEPDRAIEQRPHGDPRPHHQRHREAGGEGNANEVERFLLRRRVGGFGRRQRQPQEAGETGPREQGKHDDSLGADPPHRLNGIPASIPPARRRSTISIKLRHGPSLPRRQGGAAFPSMGAQDRDAA